MQQPLCPHPNVHALLHSTLFRVPSYLTICYSLFVFLSFFLSLPRCVAAVVSFSGTTPITSRVLWIDANVEVRRPLDELRAILAANGHFLTVQRLGFPNTLRHHPTTVTALGCTAPVGSMTQCWSGVMGISRHSWFHRHVSGLVWLGWWCYRCGAFMLLAL